MTLDDLVRRITLRESDSTAAQTRLTEGNFEAQIMQLRTRMQAVNEKISENKELHGVAASQLKVRTKIEDRELQIANHIDRRRRLYVFYSLV